MGRYGGRCPEPADSIAGTDGAGFFPAARFGFGAATPDSASAESAVSFDFGGEGEDQIPLLDASHFSPFAAQPKRPFLVMPKKTTASERPRSEERRVGQEPRYRWS